MLINGQSCNAEPISSASAEQLLELGKVRSSVEQSQQLTGEQWAVIEKSLESADDVAVAVASLLLQQMDNERSRPLLLKFEASDVRRGALTDAVLTLGQVSSKLAKTTPDQRSNQWQEMARSPNPYSRILAVKALCSIDPKAAQVVLQRLEEEKSEISAVANRIRRDLAAHIGEELPPPIPGSETIYAWFEKCAGSLAAVTFGQVKGSEISPRSKVPSSATVPSLLSPPSNKMAEAKPTSTPSEEPASSTPWSIIVALIVAATGLLWMLLKRRS